MNLDSRPLPAVDAVVTTTILEEIEELAVEIAGMLEAPQHFDISTLARSFSELDNFRAHLTRALDRVGKAIATTEGAIRDRMIETGAVTVDNAGFRFQVTARNDMRIVDVEAAAADLEARGIGDVWKSSPNRTAIIHHARAFEDSSSPVAGCERATSTIFSVKPKGK